MPRRSKAPAPDAQLTQSALIPMTRPKTTLKRVKIADIDIEPGQPEPIPTLLSNVAEWPIFQPVALGQKPDGRYFVKEGRRRVLAALEATDTYIDASITGDDVPAEVVQLTSHALRRENVVGELASVERLLAARFAAADPIDAYREIAKRLGIGVGKIKGLLRLRGLIPELRADLAGNLLSRSVATLISESSLSRADQMELHDRLVGTGKLTKSDVYKLRHRNDDPSEQQTSFIAPEPEAPSDLVDATPIRPPLQSALARLSVIRERFSFAGDASADADAMLADVVELVEHAYNLLQTAPAAYDPEPEPAPVIDDGSSAGAFAERLQRINDEYHAEAEEDGDDEEEEDDEEEQDVDDERADQRVIA